jgi:hypothetical protein
VDSDIPFARGIVTDDAAEEMPLRGRIDITVPHSARIWNYWLGGKDNYPVDRQAGDRFQEICPDIIDVARAVLRVARHERPAPPILNASDSVLSSEVATDS